MGGNYPPAKYAFDLDVACMLVSLFLVGNPEWIDNFKYGFVCDGVWVGVCVRVL